MSLNTDNSGNFQNELFTWRINAGANRVYYINIKQDKNGEMYLVIKESKSNGGKESNPKEVHRVMFFQKDFDKLRDALREVFYFIEDYESGKNPQNPGSYSNSNPENNSQNPENNQEFTNSNEDVSKSESNSYSNDNFPMGDEISLN
jgi:hypothetical protein